MFERHIHPDDIMLFSSDMALCQQVFDIVRAEARIMAGSPQSDLIAAHIIQAYKHGTRDVRDLLALARTAAIT